MLKKSRSYIKLRYNPKNQLRLTHAAVVGWVSEARPIAFLAATRAMGVASLTHPCAFHESIFSTIGIMPTAFDVHPSEAPPKATVPRDYPVKTGPYFSLPLVGRAGVGGARESRFRAIANISGCLANENGSKQVTIEKIDFTIPYLYQRTSPSYFNIRSTTVILLCSIITIAGCTRPHAASAIEKRSETDVIQVVADETHRQGQALRKAFEESYKKLSDSNGLRGGFHGTDVTDVVLPYIPIGTQFAEAEAILRDAGFVVGPRPSLSQAFDPNKTKDWYAVVSRISPFHQKLFYTSSLYVTLLPKSPGDYTDVVGIRATFFVLTP